MIAYRLFLFFDWLVMLLPRSARKKLFIAFAYVAHLMAAPRNKIVQANLDFAFGDSLSEERKQEIEGYCYQNLALNLLQVMENRHYNREDFLKRVTFKNRDVVENLLREKRAIIFISAHYGNWEIGATALASLFTPTTSIYKELKNEAFDPYLVESRSRHRMKMIRKEGALKHLTRALKNKEAVSLMIDQSSNASNGVQVDFFNHPTYHSTTPAILSSKYHAPIVALYITTEDNEHYTITFEDPIEVPSDTPEAIKEATQAQAKRLESVIRFNPKPWFWCHKRWKSEHKEIYAG